MVQTFGERVELLVTAFVDRHDKVPLVLQIDEGATQHAMLDPLFCRGGAVEPALRERSRHGAEAWRRWTNDLDPLEAVVVLKVTTEAASVTIGPAAEGILEAFRVRADAAREHARQHGIHVEAISQAEADRTLPEEATRDRSAAN